MDINIGAEDDEALDILWSMVMEEGNEAAMRNLDSDSAQTMLKSHAAFSAMLDLGDISTNKYEMDTDVHVVEDKNQVREDPLPDLIDFTPESALAVGDFWKQVKVVISFACPLPTKVGNWERYLVAARVKRRNKLSTELAVKKILLIPVTPLNPYTYRCNIPLIGIPPGPRFFTIIESILPESKLEAAVSDLLRYAWAQSFQNVSETDGKPLFFPSVNNTDSSVRILSQISNCFFEIIDPNRMDGSDSGESESKSDTSVEKQSTERQSSNASQSHQRKVFGPAPNPAMAFVAAALTDYPNPGVANAVSYRELVPTSESQLSNSRKRASVDNHEVDQNADLAGAASDWANAPSGDKDGENKLQSLDRRCKVRLVERLTNVIGETDNESTVQHDAKVKAANPDIGDVLLADKSRKVHNNPSMHSKGSSITRINEKQSEANIGFPLKVRENSSPDSLVDTINLSNIDEDEMDSLLDGLLVRIVENLMEMTSSSQDLKAELNKPDQSGFTLLHYACLYNLSSLIPILLFHGISPDIPTTKGKMTPLHLACSAGNISIVELLVQKGCNVLVQDSYGATPLDHAVRNGFSEVARWLADKVGLEYTLSQTATAASSSHPSHIEFDTISKEILIQSAFSSLSLKDKIMLNILEEKERKENQVDVMDTEEDHMDQDNKGCYQLFSKEERDGLTVAMNLMRKEELDEILERTSGDMRKWVVMRNVEALKNVEAITKDIADAEKSATIDAKTAAKKKLDEAIAGLVLRKNLDLQTSNNTLQR